jgi:hypothetical protein
MIHRRDESSEDMKGGVGSQINGLLHQGTSKIISILIHCLSEFSQSTLFPPHILIPPVCLDGSVLVVYFE